MRSCFPAKRIPCTWPWLALVLALPAVGCQVDVGGQTLPSAYFMSDDVQYFPPGNEFKLSNEAAAMQARRQSEVAPPPEGNGAVRPGWTEPKWR